jgi:hypothetical protein
VARMKMIPRIVVSLPLLALIFAPKAICLAEDQQPPAAQLVRATVANEMAAANENGIKHMFRDRKKTPRGSMTRIYVETREAMAGMTVAYDDKPLDSKQLQDEEGRLAGLVNNPDQLRRKQHEQKEDADRTLRIMKAMPDAFVFQYDGTATGTSAIGREGVQLVRLKFHPSPGYRPPSHVEEVLLGMEGVILIDPVEHRIAEIDGTLFQPVSFGWGILGRLDKGGHFLVDQADLGEHCWELSRMSLSFNGKLLLIKTLAYKSEEVFSDFRRVPNDTSFAQGVKLIEEEVAKGQGSSETAKAENTSGKAN